MGCNQSSAVSSPPSPALSEQQTATATTSKNGTSRTVADVCSTGTHKTHQHEPRNNTFSIVDRLPPKPDSTKRNEILKHLLVEKKRDFCDYYDIVQQIGKGSISNIYLVTKKKTAGATSSPIEGKDSTSGQPTELKDDVLYALKEIDPSLLNPVFKKEMRNEIKLLRELDHPNIERIYEVYIHPKTGSLSIIMDYCSGGDLNARKPYTERQAQSIIWCLCEALNYMHSPTPDVIIHRDIKFENILFESTAEDAQIKLIDFGLSVKYGNMMLNGQVGTAYTMAPEVIRKDEGYDTKADMWSVGVVTYQLLAGKPPFWTPGKPTDTMALVLKGSYNFNGPEWGTVSAEAKSFIAKLLKMGPSTRMSAQQALQHPWLKSLAYPKKEDVDYDFIARCYDNANEYATSSDFHKLALQAIARHTTTEEVVKLRQAFHTLDADNSGVITYREMRRVLGDRYPTRDIKDLFAQMDVDESGRINYTEFLAATMGVNGEITERRIQEAFEVFDTDDSGFISRDDLRQMLGKDAEESFVERLLKEADVDQNGSISLEDFKQLFRENHKEVAMKGLHSAE